MQKEIKFYCECEDYNCAKHVFMSEEEGISIKHMDLKLIIKSCNTKPHREGLVKKRDEYFLFFNRR